MFKNWSDKSKILVSILLITIAAFLLINFNRQAGTKETKTPSQERPRQTTNIDDCTLTPSDSEGPYYQAGSPTRDVLSPPDTESQRLVMKGVILNEDCEPIENAVLDIWHADADGNYDDEWYRGKIVTNENGEYEFETVMPAAYGSALARRPAHIHYKVWMGENELLTSQVYFDEEIVNEVGQERMVSLSGEGEMIEGRFNIVVDEATN